MKVNAPEKIYVHVRYKPCEITFSEVKEEGVSNVEYVRTDAFIEKACEWIKTNMDDYIHVEYDTVTGKPTNEAYIAHKKVVEDFRKYMEE